MSKGEQLNALYESLDSYKQDIALADALSRLQTNPDFIKIITDGYLTKSALNLVEFTGDPECVGRLETDAFKEIQGIGKLKNYFKSIKDRSNQAAYSMNATLDEISKLEQSTDDEGDE